MHAIIPLQTIYSHSLAMPLQKSTGDIGHTSVSITMNIYTLLQSVLLQSS